MQKPCGVQSEGEEAWGRTEKKLKSRKWGQDKCNQREPREQGLVNLDSERARMKEGRRDRAELGRERNMKRWSRGYSETEQ